jgi:hypothetical protein
MIMNIAAVFTTGVLAMLELVAVKATSSIVTCFFSIIFCRIMGKCYYINKSHSLENFLCLDTFAVKSLAGNLQKLLMILQNE